jgi:superoxide reductase
LSTAAAIAALFLAAPAVAEEYTPQISEDFYEVRKEGTYDPKHTPKIVAPDKVKRGEWFDVTVEIGKGARHPSLAEHAVAWIALFNNEVEMARTYIHPVFVSPKVTWTIRLEKSTTIRAMEAPNHTAAWESTHKIEVTD